MKRKRNPEKRPRRNVPIGQPVSTGRFVLGNTFDLLRRFGAHIVWALAAVYIAHEIAPAVIAFAGKTTLADMNLGLSLLADIGVNWTINLTVSGISIALYIRERRNHGKSRARLGDRITKLEQQIDKGRTSSNLTAEGLTRREDT